MKTFGTSKVYGRHRKSLSQLTTDFRQLQRAFQEELWGIDVFRAPAECKAKVYNAWDQAAAAFFKRNGISQDDFLAAVRKRTSARWTHFHIYP